MLFVQVMSTQKWEEMRFEKADRENNSFEEQWEIESRNLPSGRITTAEEVANTIAFLLSDAAENIVGEAVKISGGSVMR